MAETKEYVFYCNTEKEKLDRIEQLTKEGRDPKVEWRNGQLCVVVYI